MLDIATEAQYPTQPVTLYKLPQENGVVVLDGSDYLPLPRGQVSSNRAQGPEFNLYVDTYTGTGDFETIGARSQITFLDNSAEDLRLLKVGEQGVIFQVYDRGYTSVGRGEVLLEDRVQIAPGMWLRKAKAA